MRNAFLWENGQFHDLGRLGSCCSDAYDISETGLVVGWTSVEGGDFHAALWRPLTPSESIDSILSRVDDLLAQGVLNNGQARSLANKLNIAKAMLEDGRPIPATNQLEAFINEVEAMSGGGLTVAEAQNLIDLVNSAIAGI